MQKVKLFEQFLFEIGDRSVQPYQYNINGKIAEMGELGSEMYVEFTTDSKLEYELKLANINMSLEVDFFVANLKDNYAETNRGEMFKIMATIAEVIEQTLTANPEIRGLRYEPKAKGGDNGKDRDRLYRLFINKAAKTMGKKVKFMQQGGTVFAILK